MSLLNKLSFALGLGISLNTLVACGGYSPLPLRPITPAPLRVLNTPAPGTTGQIVVRYKAQPALSSQSTLSRLGLRKMGSVGHPQSGTEVIQVRPGQSLPQTVETLRRQGDVLYAEPVYTTSFRVLPSQETPGLQSQNANTFPNDPFYAKQYAHRKTQAPQAWQMVEKGPDSVIAIVDSGVDVNHPDLQSKVLASYNAVDHSKDVTDELGHGTHVAGIAAATIHNELGVAGTGAYSKILAVKVVPRGGGDPTSVSVANGIIWAADNGAHVINLSLGFTQPPQILVDAVNYALAKNILVVAAMGNNGYNKRMWPAAIPGVLAVGATNQEDQRSGFSNSGEWLSVTAPGSDIYSTLPLHTNKMGKIEYGNVSGTSMATPFVTGLAGMLRSQNPQLNARDLKTIIEKSADDLGARGYDPEFGHGRVNLRKAMELVHR